jgi:hypothetical protein
LEQLAGGLNRRTLKSREQIEAAIEKALQGASASLTLTLQEERTSELVRNRSNPSLSGTPMGFAALYPSYPKTTDCRIG